MYARRIDKNGLRACSPAVGEDVDYAENAIAGGLRLGANDGQFLARQRIQQGRFSGIRPAENTDKTGAKRHRSDELDLLGMCD